MAKKINTPYGRLFVQLLRQSFDDSTVNKLFIRLGTRLSVQQELIQENNKQTSSNKLLIILLNIALIPAFLTVIKLFPDSYEFFTEDIIGRLIVILALTTASGAIILDRVLNGGDRIG